ncbi:MBL fold metallo-hydrolase [Synechococcus sp. MIT S1220]|uniref:MBL fold metallo-hydrolase n=1 Tax=Synechococcus sp. MIT S1220 TaxID=3082549 RepID=UPI0039AF605E
MTTALEAGRPPQQLRPDLWIFPPNRDCQGGSSWWLECGDEPVLVDCPPLTEATLTALEQLAAGRKARILLTSREGHGRLRRIQSAFGWPVLVQEQEAYLLPGIQPLETFDREHRTGGGLQLLWTPGPTPGSCVIHAPAPTNLLFCGRLLTPLAPGRLGPLRHGRTFHWPRQLRSLDRLREWLLPEARPELASGAALGALRGERLVPFNGCEWSSESS